MLDELRRLRGLVSVGTVGGSDLVKQKEQLGDDGAPRFCCCVFFCLLLRRWAAGWQHAAVQAQNA